MKTLRVMLLFVIVSFICIAAAGAWVSGAFVNPRLPLEEGSQIRVDTECQTYKNYSACWYILRNQCVRGTTDYKTIWGCYFKNEEECFHLIGEQAVEWTGQHHSENKSYMREDVDYVYATLSTPPTDPPPVDPPPVDPPPTADCSACEAEKDRLQSIKDRIEAILNE